VGGPCEGIHDPSAEAVWRLAVRQIGDMVRRGASVKEIVEDYPYLEEEDVDFAKQYATANPRVGIRVSVKLLLDENLSPAAAVALRADGIDAYQLHDQRRTSCER
jgi:hypothetical protein